MNQMRMLVLLDDSASGVRLRRGMVAEGSLRSLVQQTIQFKFYSRAAGNTRITRDNPFLEASEAEHLDADGIVLSGTIVQPNMAAVSAIEPTTPHKQAALLAAVLSDPSSYAVRNATAYFAPEHVGYTVTKVTRENIRDDSAKRTLRFEPGMIDRVTVSLERRDEVAVGDFLKIADQAVVVADIVADALLPVDASGRVVDAVVPLSAKPTAGNRTIELVTVSRLQPSVCDELQVRSVGPYSLITLTPLSRRGFQGQVVTAQQIAWLHENQFVALAAELASLKCDDTLNRQKLKQLADGLLSFPLNTQIGAPASLFLVMEELRLLGLSVDCEARDSCIALRLAPATSGWLEAAAPSVIKKSDSLNYRTYRPEPGGLFCEATFGPETHARRTRAARIELVEPIVPIIFRLGTEPILSRLLGLPSAEIEALVSSQSGLDSEQQIVSGDDGRCKIKGPRAIGQLLEHCRVDAPFAPVNMMASAVYVTPPDFRPLVLLHNGNFATSDLNDLYRRVINRNNRLRKLRELNAPPAIIDSEIRALQQTVDQLQANGWKSKPILGSGNRPLKSGLDLVLLRLCGEDAKRVDWSAAARAIVDTQLADDACQLPPAIYDGLRCNPEHPMLLTTGSSFVACTPARGEDLVIRVSAASAVRLELQSGAKCFVHRPVTLAAIAEAQRLRAATNVRPAPAVDSLDRQTQLDLLLENIRTCQPLVLDSPRLFLIGGSGSLQRRADEDSPIPQEDMRQVPKPSLPPPSIEELKEVVESTVLESCVFRLVPLGPHEKQPLPREGRVGGQPWLPVDAVWPHIDGQHVPFLGQFPISPEFNRSLPFEVEQDMLLTLFWSEDWWEPKPTSAPYLLLHGVDDLHLADLPADVPGRPLLRLELEIKPQLPSWGEIERTLRLHFDRVPAALLKELKNAYVDDPRFVSEQSRIGGYGYWIQESDDDLVVQLVAEDAAELSFGDAGSLYIVGSAPEQLMAFVQSH